MSFITNLSNQASELQKYDGQGLTLVVALLKKVAAFVGGLIAKILPELTALLLFTGVALILTFPTVLTARQELIGDGGDNNGFAVSQYIVGQKLAAGEYPFGHTDVFRYPYGFNFGVGADAALLTVIGSYLQPILGVVLAYNLTVWLGFVLTAFSAFILARYLSKKMMVGLVAGVMYGFSFYSLARGAGHLNLLMTGGFPLLLYAVLKLREQVTLPRLVTAIAGVALVTAGSLQYALMVPVAVLVMGLLALAIWPRLVAQTLQTWLRKTHLFVMAGLIAGLLVLSHAWPYVNRLATGEFMWRSDERAQLLEKYNITASDLVVPNAQSKLRLNALVPSTAAVSIEHASAFVGYIELAILLLFIFSPVSKKTKVWVVSAVVILLTLVLGVSEAGVSLPYAWLVKLFPFSGILESGRFIVLVNLMIVIALATWLGKINNKWLVSILAVILITGLVAERLPTEYYHSKSPESKATAAMANLSGKAVLNLPLDTNLGTYNLQPAFTHKAIADGYFHWSAETTETQKLFEGSGLAKRFFCSNEDQVFTHLNDPTALAEELQQNRLLLTELYQRGITTIAVHKDGIYFHPHCENVRTRVGLLLPVLETLQTDIYQQKFERHYRNTQLNVSFFVPQDGTFDLEGIYAYPEVAKDLTFQVASTSAQFEFESDQAGGLVFRGLDDNFQLKPAMHFEVKAGQIISFSSSAFVEDGLLSIWFKYQAATDIEPLNATPLLQQVYADSATEIYQITR